jgi:hypothetical protein
VLSGFRCGIYCTVMYMNITGKGMKIKLCVSEQNKYFLHFAVGTFFVIYWSTIHSEKHILCTKLYKKKCEQAHEANM